MMNNRRVLFAIVIVGISVSIGFFISEASQAVGIRIHSKDLPEHGLIIVKPSDPEFDAIARATLKNITTDELDAVRLFSVAIKNTGPKTVMAHTIIWEGVDHAEKKKSYIINYANSEAFTDQLEFMESIGRTNLDKTIKAGGARLLSLTPLRREGPSGGGGGSRQGTSGSEQSQVSANITQRQEQMRSELMTYSDLTISIDGAFFEDGSFVGPDTSGSFDRLVAQVDAKRALRKFVAESLKLNRTHAQIFEDVQTKADMEVTTPNDKGPITDYFEYFTKFFANQLLLQKNHYGEANALSRVVRSHDQPQPTLSRRKQ